MLSFLLFCFCFGLFCLFYMESFSIFLLFPLFYRLYFFGSGGFWFICNGCTVFLFLGLVRRFLPTNIISTIWRRLENILCCSHTTQNILNCFLLLFYFCQYFVVLLLYAIFKNLIIIQLNHLWLNIELFFKQLFKKWILCFWFFCRFFLVALYELINILFKFLWVLLEFSKNWFKFFLILTDVNHHFLLICEISQGSCFEIYVFELWILKHGHKLFIQFLIFLGIFMLYYVNFFWILDFSWLNFFLGLGLDHIHRRRFARRLRTGSRWHVWGICD